MLLHEAVKKARKDLGMSQKQLAELAGVQRKQLGTLENGGNVTLSTLRKVLGHLPNLETFTLDAVTATVRHYVPPEEKQKAVDTAMDLLNTAVRSLVVALGAGTMPDQTALTTLRQANEVLQRGLGYSPEDLERRHQRNREQLAAMGIDEEAAAEVIATFIDQAQAEVLDDLRMITAPDDGDSEEEEEGEEGSS